jgi:hypothetical protein
MKQAKLLFLLIAALAFASCKPRSRGDRHLGYSSRHTQVSVPATTDLGFQKSEVTLPQGEAGFRESEVEMGMVRLDFRNRNCKRAQQGWISGIPTSTASVAAHRPRIR